MSAVLRLITRQLYPVQEKSGAYKLNVLQQKCYAAAQSDSVLHGYTHHAC